MSFDAFDKENGPQKGPWTKKRAHTGPVQVLFSVAIAKELWTPDVELYNTGETSVSLGSLFCAVFLVAFLVQYLLIAFNF